GGPQGVGVVPVGLVVVDEGDGDAVAGFEAGGVLADLLGGVADGDGDVVDADRGEAGDDGVEDRLGLGEREEGFGELVGVGAQALALSRGEDDASHLLRAFRSCAGAGARSAGPGGGGGTRSRAAVIARPSLQGPEGGRPRPSVRQHTPAGASNWEGTAREVLARGRGSRTAICSTTPGASRLRPHLEAACLARFSESVSRNSSVVCHACSGPTSSARSLVMLPPWTVSMTTCSRSLAKPVTSGVPSSLPRWARPRVQAKIEAIGFVEVGLPAWCWR